MSTRLPRRPTCQTVKVPIQRRIAKGGWKPGVRLPSERELVQEFACARMTVHRALREVVAEGLIERRRGSGFVRWRKTPNFQPARCARHLTKRSPSVVTGTPPGYAA